MDIIQRYQQSLHEFNKAKSLMEKGRLPEAEILLRNALAFFPREILMEESTTIDGMIRDSYETLFINIKLQLEIIDAIKQPAPAPTPKVRQPAHSQKKSSTAYMSLQDVMRRNLGLEPDREEEVFSNSIDDYEASIPTDETIFDGDFSPPTVTPETTKILRPPVEPSDRKHSDKKSFKDTSDIVDAENLLNDLIEQDADVIPAALRPRSQPPESIAYQSDNAVAPDILKDIASASLDETDSAALPLKNIAEREDSDKALSESNDLEPDIADEIISANIDDGTKESTVGSQQESPENSSQPIQESVQGTTQEFVQETISDASAIPASAIPASAIPDSATAEQQPDLASDIAEKLARHPEDFSDVSFKENEIQPDVNAATVLDQEFSALMTSSIETAENQIKKEDQKDAGGSEIDGILQELKNSELLEAEKEAETASKKSGVVTDSASPAPPPKQSADSHVDSSAEETPPPFDKTAPTGGARDSSSGGTPMPEKEDKKKTSEKKNPLSGLIVGLSYFMQRFKKKSSEQPEQAIPAVETTESEVPAPVAETEPAPSPAPATEPAPAPEPAPATEPETASASKETSEIKSDKKKKSGAAKKTKGKSSAKINPAQAAAAVLVVGLIAASCWFYYDGKKKTSAQDITYNEVFSASEILEKSGEEKAPAKEGESKLPEREKPAEELIKPVIEKLETYNRKGNNSSPTRSASALSTLSIAQKLFSSGKPELSAALISSASAKGISSPPLSELLAVSLFEAGIKTAKNNVKDMDAASEKFLRGADALRSDGVSPLSAMIINRKYAHYAVAVYATSITMNISAKNLDGALSRFKELKNIAPLAPGKSRIYIAQATESFSNAVTTAIKEAQAKGDTALAASLTEKLK